MTIFESSHQRAQIIIGLLGLVLVVALWPYATGLIGAPVLYVIFEPVYRRMHGRLGIELSAALVVAAVLFLLLVPGLSLAGLIVAETQQAAAGIINGPVLSRLSELRFGDWEIGPWILNLGERTGEWIGESALDLISAVTNLALNITIALFGLYFLLVSRGGAWQAVSPYIPFSPDNTALLRKSFRDVTNSTLIGIGLTAAIQGTMIGVAFWVAGLANAFFWGVVTAVLAILPVVGSGLVWGPGAIALILANRYGAAIAMLLWGALIVASVDNVIRPLVYNKWARIHPLVTLVGALAGIRFFGLLGLLIGPLTLSYFFELIRMYRSEYIEEPGYTAEWRSLWTK